MVVSAPITVSAELLTQSPQKNNKTNQNKRNQKPNRTNKHKSNHSLREYRESSHVRIIYPQPLTCPILRLLCPGFRRQLCYVTPFLGQESISRPKYRYHRTQLGEPTCQDYYRNMVSYRSRNNSPRTRVSVSSPCCFRRHGPSKYSQFGGLHEAFVSLTSMLRELPCRMNCVISPQSIYIPSEHPMP